MKEKPEEMSSTMSEEEANQLLRSLLHKEGTWPEWGQACYALQKAGYSSQTIFEQSGFQASQQNLIIVASQVYDSLVKEGLSEDTLTYYQGPRSDVLYEFRILNQQQRASVAELAKEKKLDADEAKELAKAYQTFSRLSQLPAGFENHPGDAMAYQCWKSARQKKDLQERSRLIAKGLKFAHSLTAREAIEKLLSDFTVVSSRTAPLMPVYRLEQENELARIIPFVGSFPLTREAVEGVKAIASEEPFQVVKMEHQGAIVPLPGWQVILKAQDPVVILSMSDQLPNPLPGKPEEVLVVVDRAFQEWDVNNYYLVEQGENLGLQWFEEEPSLPILGQVILVMRPKKIFDENNLLEPWQMDD
ncbi:conserved hypothetical protein [Gloeothece citriformis PCC 7424]|uniref:RuBisCO accumulation factor 1 n=1 Tax=Gloeothece citriformis (strain PCC 7424) TaxID=65393 RepID=B7K7W5_GLOC7|nr:RuBisCO accumulation factor 1 [Gloeothece citriformis]ACK71161.1 conserved hypothetical protein [Gloeothece citriformis PCC 7424]